MTGGRATVVLVSGDGGGASGDEPAVMTTYLAERGVDRRRVVADPFGLDTYDSCARAREVYGVERALIVTQSYHLSRAVTLCRHLGLDVDGVTARCDGCGAALLAEKSIRDYFASGKAAWDAGRGRPPRCARRRIRRSRTRCGADPPGSGGPWPRLEWSGIQAVAKAATAAGVDLGGQRGRPVQRLRAGRRRPASWPASGGRPR